MESELEREGKFDVSWLYNKKEELKRNQLGIDQELQNLENIILEQVENLKSLNLKKDNLNSQINKINQELSQINEKSQGNKDEIINAKLEECILEIQKSEKLEDIQNIKNILNQINLKIKKVLVVLSDQEQKEEIKQLRNELEKLSQEKENNFNLINQANLENVSAKERKRLLMAQQSQIQNELNAIEEKLSKAQKTPENSLEDIKSQLDPLKLKLSEKEEKIKKSQVEISQLSQKEQEKQKAIFEKQKKAQEFQKEINQIQNNLNEIKIKATRYETRLEDLETEIRVECNEINQSLEIYESDQTTNQAQVISLKTIKETRIEEYVNIDEARGKIKKIKRQLEFIGNIDPQIEKEHSEIKNRYNFLTSQIKDLSETIARLEQVIKDLDKNIKEKFYCQFNVISKNFKEYFKILFNGGNAEIIKIEALVETEESVENATNNLNDFLKKHNATGLAGIDIQATPPGKKIQSINMLSGGERALTAIALICACLSANPSPFVVLDEVDAALDEFNSERLAKILDKLSHKTQFITITHNRAIMRRANVLYGVTMEDSGVSKLLSLNLEDVINYF